jgi:pimeloyl-ACP methyl ester carboxylesterase
MLYNAFYSGVSLSVHCLCLHYHNSACRVFTIHGSADEIIPVEDALEFAKIIPNHSLHIIEGANHSYTSHQTELAAVVLKLMKATLQQD